MNDLDKMARELLAAEWDLHGYYSYAAEMRAGRNHLIRTELSLAAIRAALLTAPPGYVLVPLELAGRLQASIGAFVSDEGWVAADMGTADDLSALLAAAPEVK